jgi:O-antigen/teichoic acid export membrane protein
MPKLQHKLPAWVWQMLLMGLLGLSGIIFVPVLLRWADPQLMATVLVAQVYVYYLVVLVQYGFAFSGPAAVARAVDAASVAQVWRSSVRGKLLLLVGPVAVVFGVGYVCMAWGQWYVWVFAALLGAYALNSNWWLQAQQRIAPAVGFAALGVMASAGVVYALVSGYVGSAATGQGAWLVLVLVLPQVCVGVGTWWVARVDANHVAKLSTSSAANISWLRADAPLVASQLLLLASTTLGTVVVGGLADATTTAAYAATEKLFNLAATVLVGLYMAFYPRLAGLFYSNRGLYWRTTQRLLLVCVCGGLVLAAVLALVGPVLLGWYLPTHMVALVAPVLWPLGLWLGLCISQHVLTSHLVLAERKHMVLWANGCVLLATVVVGYACALTTPVAWVYGMVAGQVLALAWLLHMCSQERAMVA